MTAVATDTLFPEAFAGLKSRAGLTFRQLSARTRQVDPARKGLSHGHLARLANGEEPILPDAMRMIAAAFDEIEGPTYFVEYRMAELRDAFDPRLGDPRQVLQRFLAWEALPEARREVILSAGS